MNTVQKTIDELNVALNRINDVSIIALEQKDFEKLLAGVYGVLNNYQSRRESASNSSDILNLAFQMLDRILKYHIANRLFVTPNTVHIYNKTVDLLLNLAARDFNINESAYGEAMEIHMFLRALTASGILPIGHQRPAFWGRWSNSESEEKSQNEALNYAAANIKRYSSFVFDMANNNRYIRDPFTCEPTASHLAIYSKIKSLTTSYNLLPSEQPS